ncbi:hypothetical protein BME99_31440 [Pseudomonas protegens]|nr:hypothetical protein BME99_31440 [Pseudomonas protegens]
MNREVAADVADPGDLQQVAGQKAVIPTQVRDHHLQQEIRFTRYQERRDHLRQLQYRLAEGFGLGIVVSLHLDPDEHGQPQAHLVAVQGGLVATDHPGLFQHAHPAQAG